MEIYEKVLKRIEGGNLDNFDLDVQIINGIQRCVNPSIQVVFYYKFNGTILDLKGQVNYHKVTTEFEKKFRELRKEKEIVDLSNL